MSICLSLKLIFQNEIDVDRPALIERIDKIASTNLFNNRTNCCFICYITTDPMLERVLTHFEEHS